uniref:Uncharacterized protein n=1 Tax=Lotharella globosa TaxID=91324 RepID=A0A7S4DYM6_9EUKA
MAWAVITLASSLSPRPAHVSRVAKASVSTRGLSVQSNPSSFALLPPSLPRRNLANSRLTTRNPSRPFSRAPYPSPGVFESNVDGSSREEKEDRGGEDTEKGDEGAYLSWLRKSPVVCEAADTMGLDTTAVASLQRHELESLIKSYVDKRRSLIADRRSSMSLPSNVDALIHEVTTTPTHVSISTCEAATALGTLVSAEPARAEDVFAALQSAYIYRAVMHSEPDLRRDWDFVSLAALKSLGQLGVSVPGYSRAVFDLMRAAWGGVEYYVNPEKGNMVYHSVQAEKSRTAVEFLGKLAHANPELAGEAARELSTALMSAQFPSMVRVEAAESLQGVRGKLLVFGPAFRRASNLLRLARQDCEELHETFKSEAYHQFREQETAKAKLCPKEYASPDAPARLGNMGWMIAILTLLLIGTASLAFACT